MGKITLLVIREDLEPECIQVENHYKVMQSIVGGLIQFMPFDKSNPECELMVNEEYLLNGSRFNRYVKSDFHTVENGGALELGVPIMGTFAVVRNSMDDGEMVSLTQEDLDKYIPMFKLHKRKFDMKKLNCTIFYKSVGTVAIEVPDEYSLEQAINWAKNNTDKIPLPYNAEYFEDSIAIDEDNCDFGM